MGVAFVLGVWTWRGRRMIWFKLCWAWLAGWWWRGGVWVGLAYGFFSSYACIVAGLAG